VKYGVKTAKRRYGIVEFNVPLDTLVILETILQIT